jgi:hypothetical protein
MYISYTVSYNNFSIAFFLFLIQTTYNLYMEILNGTHKNHKPIFHTFTIHNSKKIPSVEWKIHWQTSLRVNRKMFLHDLHDCKQ